MPRSVARLGLLTFAALATVALIIGLALAKPPAQQQASLAPDAPAPAPAPPREDPPVPAPPEDAAPVPSPPAEDPAPAPTEEPGPVPSPQPEEPAPPAEDTTPVSTPALDVKGAADYVRAFYADLEQRRFRAAWPRLADDLRKSHGSFEAWERGFANTVSQSASDVSAKAVGPDTAQVSLTLTAVDRDKRDCEVTRRFAILWRLDHTGEDWHAVHAEGKALKSPPTGVAASCAAKPPARASGED